MPIPKKAVRGVALTLGLFLTLHLGVAGWTAWRLSRLDADWQKALDDHRRQQAQQTLPVLGAAIDGNAAPRYAALFKAAQDWKLTEAQKSAWKGALDAGAAKPMPSDIQRLLHAHAADWASLKTALRHNHCDWQFPYEKGLMAELPPFLEIRRLGEGLVLMGNLRWSQGDRPGAWDDYLQAFRFGGDIARGGLIISHVVGARIQKLALEAMQRATSDTPAASRPGLAARLRAMQELLPSAERALHSESLALGGYGHEQKQTLQPWSPVSVLSGAVNADFVGQVQAFYHTVLAEAATLPPAERDRLLKEHSAKLIKSPNPLVALAMPDFSKTLGRLDETNASYQQLSRSLTR